MILPIEKQFEQLEASRKHWLQQTDKLSQEQLQFRADEHSWTITQVYQHLFLSEQKALQYVRKKMMALGNLPKTTVGSRFKSFALEIALRAPVRFKVPRKTPVYPREIIDYNTLKDNWQHLRDDWRKTLDEFDVPASKKLVFRHPRSGMLSITQTLKFFQAHFDHHMKQIERIRKHPGFPKN